MITISLIKSLKQEVKTLNSFNIGHAVVDTFKGIPSTRIGCLGLNSLILQDDISKMNDNLNQAREGCEKIDETLKKKQLSVNYDKSKFLVMGSRKFRKETLEEINENPMKMGEAVIEHSEKEKYLGDFIHENGCRESIAATIKARMNGLMKKCDDIIAVSEAPLMGSTGNALPAIKLFEAQVIPALLHNSESWIDITETHIADLESFQEKFNDFIVVFEFRYLSAGYLYYFEKSKELDNLIQTLCSNGIDERNKERNYQKFDVKYK